MSGFEQSVPEMETPVQDASYSINPGHTLMDGRLRVISTFREIHTVLYASEAEEATLQVAELNERAKATAIHTIRDTEANRTIVAKVFADRDAHELNNGSSEIAANLALNGIENFVPQLGATRMTVAGTTRRVMFSEFMMGGRLDTYLLRKGPMSLDEASPAIVGIAKALESAHHLGIAHRDVTPYNVFRNPSSKTWALGDLSIAQRTMRDPITEGTQSVPKRIWNKITYHEFPEFAPIEGTVRFMPPERVAAYERGKLEAEDSYSLGMLVTYMLTGSNPIKLGQGSPFEDWSKRVRELGKEPPSTEELEDVGTSAQIIDFVRSSTGVPANRPSPSDAAALFEAA